MYEELLKKLLAAEVLTEETRQELEAAFTTHVTEAVSKAREEATAVVTADLNEQWITERETLIEAIDGKVSEILSEEMKELKEDIERFRDLEAEYAERLIEAKEVMATTLKGDMDQLIEKLDSFLEIRLTAEIDELKEDIDVVKKNEFGKKIFEAFVTEYKKGYSDDASAEGKLNEAEQRLDDTLTALEEAEKKIASMERAQKMSAVLSPLSGRTREVMEAVLKSVETPLLEDAYSTYIGRIMKETSGKDGKPAAEKEDKVLAEGVKEKEITGNVVNGDTAPVLEEAVVAKEHTKPLFADAKKQRLQRLAGIRK